MSSPAASVPPAVSAVLVGFSEGIDDLRAAVASLDVPEVATQVVYVDQRADAARIAGVRALGDGVLVVEAGRNVGYVEACRLGAAAAGAERLLFLNPDATLAPGCLAELVHCLDADPAVAVAGAQVALPDGARVNAGDNPVHLTGVAWSGRWGDPLEDGPPREVAAVSGAAMLVRREAFEALDGFQAGFFMYYDDVDFAWRARLAGWRVLFVPRAVALHDYEFEKGDYKWRLLERNRLWSVLSLYERRTLLLLAPLLAAFEIAVLLAALRGGWAGAKVAAWRGLWRDRARLRAARRRAQAGRRVGDAEILRLMTATLDSPVFPAGAARAVAPVLRPYRRLLLLLLS